MDSDSDSSPQDFDIVLAYLGAHAPPAADDFVAKFDESAVYLRSSVGGMTFSTWVKSDGLRFILRMVHGKTYEEVKIIKCIQSFDNPEFALCSGTLLVHPVTKGGASVLQIPRVHTCDLDAEGPCECNEGAHGLLARMDGCEDETDDEFAFRSGSLEMACAIPLNQHKLDILHAAVATTLTEELAAPDQGYSPSSPAFSPSSPARSAILARSDTFVGKPGGVKRSAANADSSDREDAAAGRAAAGGAAKKKLKM